MKLLLPKLNIASRNDLVGEFFAFRQLLNIAMEIAHG